MEDSNNTLGSQTENSAGGLNSDGTASSKDTYIPDTNVSMAGLNMKANEINSADEVRQAIKAVLSGKTPQIQNEETDSTDPIPLATNTTSEEIQVSLSHEYKPESGDQLLVPKQDKTRKRRGRPQKAGPSKRVKKVTVEDFYVGKLSNVVAFPTSNRKRSRKSESDSDASIYTPYSPNQWLRMRYYK